MAAVAPPASDQSADLLQKLSLDSQSKDLEVADSEKKPTAYQTLANGIGKPYERSTTPFAQNFVDPTMWYFPNGYPPAAYYSGGYPGSGNEWDNYNIYANPDGVEMPPGLYGDNGSLVYYHGYYPPYSAYHSPDSPIPTMGDDGQLYGPQNYQYPYYQSSTPNGEPFSVNQADAPQKGVSTSTGAEQVPFHVDTAKMNQTSVESFGNVNGTNASKPLKSNQNSCLGANGSYGRGGRPKDGIPSPNPWLDGSKFPDGKPKHAPVLQGTNFLPGKNQNLHPLSHLTGPQHHMPTFGMSNVGFIDRSYPNNRMYSQYAHTFRTGAGFGFNGYGARLNGRGWVDGKYKPRVYGNGLFGHGIGNVDGLNELKRGPRIKGFKNQKDLEPIASGEKEQNTQLHGNDSEDNLSGKDLPESYPDAKFFIIKSYSEDDVHKSIKYSVWASTSNGNKKLDGAYHEAQTAGCPVFLFFSVNASGQFVGLAEMVGTVDFTKSVEYWQQDKWTGSFPVKWRIVKDIPNSLLKHIILENNENKPVTNSRDTQEVKFDQGIEILKIFKGHSSRTCILDDFGFYESRQRIMQERKSKHMHMNNKLVGSKKLADAVVTDEGKDGSLGGKSLEIAPSGDIEDSDPAAQESVDIVSTILTEETVAATGEPEKMPTIAAAAEDVSGNAC